MASTQTGSSEVVEETHNFLWIIPNHAHVVSKQWLLGMANRFLIFTSESGKQYRLKIGYKMIKGKTFAPYIKLLKPDSDDALPYLKWSLFFVSKLQPDRKEKLLFEVKLPGTFFRNRKIHSNALLMPLKSSLPTDSEGCLTWKVAITLYETHSAKTVPDFKPSFIQTLQTNMGHLLTDSSSADLQIVCSDGVQLVAHKLILCAQNPVFAAMLNSNMTKKTTGSVKIADVSSITMKILLALLYTGELESAWREPENIVEFTYAAGKYQLTDVLETLGKLLGTFDHGDNNLQLLNLATKLSLKNAETRLLPLVKESVNKVTNSSDLFKVLEI